MNGQSDWNKQEIYTLVGYYQPNNTFVNTHGEIFRVITYRNVNKYLTHDTLSAVNLRWSEALNTWVIFQAVLLE